VTAAGDGMTAAAGSGGDSPTSVSSSTSGVSSSTAADQEYLVMLVVTRNAPDALRPLAAAIMASVPQVRVLSWVVS